VILKNFGKVLRKVVHLSAWGFCNRDFPFHQFKRILKVLFAALNWGLGHATRCIPLIRALEERGVEVVLASDGVAKYLWQAEFPHLNVIKLPSYRIQYDSNNMVWNIARQLPRLVYAIRSERRAMDALVEANGITHIISDNRYGCFSKKAKSILITHQVHLKIPVVGLDWLVNQVLKRALSRFDEVWIPDQAQLPHLAGSLSHPAPLQPPSRYIGILSRMQSGPERSDYDVAIVLSGPEPQRSLLERRLIEQAIALPYKFIVVQGRPKQSHHHFEAENVEVVSYLTSEALNQVLLGSSVVVCRSGYSSMMDLAVLGKKAILIPTPGQTEQEYLAHHLAQQGLFVVQHQDQILLEKALTEVHQTTGFRVGSFSEKQYLKVIDSL
jgi:uncharacterized protein (TIGR00661 family)